LTFQNLILTKAVRDFTRLILWTVFESPKDPVIKLVMDTE